MACGRCEPRCDAARPPRRQPLRHNDSSPPNAPHRFTAATERMSGQHRGQDDEEWRIFGAIAPGPVADGRVGVSKRVGGGGGAPHRDRWRSPPWLRPQDPADVADAEIIARRHPGSPKALRQLPELGRGVISLEWRARVLGSARRGCFSRTLAWRARLGGRSPPRVRAGNSAQIPRFILREKKSAAAASNEIGRPLRNSGGARNKPETRARQKKHLWKKGGWFRVSILWPRRLRRYPWSSGSRGPGSEPETGKGDNNDEIP